MTVLATGRKSLKSSLIYQFPESEGGDKTDLLIEVLDSHYFQFLISS